MAGGAYIAYVAWAVVLAALLYVRFRSLRRVRRLRLERLWIVPALYAVIAGTILFQFVPTPMQWLYLALALLVGGAIGWRRGKLMRISVDPVTHELNQQASPAAMLVILVLIVVRAGLRAEADRMGFDLAFITDLLVISALGLFAATRAEMFVRARKMLAQTYGDTPC